MIRLAEGKKVFISGKITEEEPNIKENKEGYPKKFRVAQLQLERLGYIVMNPAILPLGFEHQDYMEICYKMIDACEAIVFLRDWEDSTGARMEMQYVKNQGKEILFYDDIMVEAFLDQLIDLRQEKDNDMRSDLQIGDEDSVYIKDYAALEWAVELLKHKNYRKYPPAPAGMTK